MDASLALMPNPAQSATIAAPSKSADYQTARKAASEFEGVFVGQMLQQMFQGVSTDPITGGGPGEDMFRSMMIDQYGKQLASRGGFGLTDAITRVLLAHQEAKPAETAQ